MKKIYYFCPDFPQPSGGIKTLYRHVWRLNRLGFDAAIVHQKHGFTVDWHSYDVPVLWLQDRPPFTPQDVWVFPEVMADTVRKTSNFGGTRVVFALSWLPSYSRLRPGERWQDHGINHIITKSPTIQRHLRWSMEIDATLIPEFVDPDLYHPNDEKSAQICYTTRKDQSGPWLQGVLERRSGATDQFSWVALREMNEATYAQNLREAQIYLATTMQEGMHVSVLEAMACGCVVVGYSGIGGADYMRGSGQEANALLVENGNLLQLGQRLEEVLADFHANPGKFESIIASGIETAKQYQDPEAEAVALKTFFEGLS